MKNKLLGYFLLFTLLFPLYPSPVRAEILNIPTNEQVIEIEAKPVDRRAQILKDYLAKHNSPLENHAQDFVEAADTYELDWKLVASIAGVESTFGKRIPGGHDPLYTSYNGWGWGVYGDNVLKFKSWKEAIYTISDGLKTNYVDKGYTEPLSMNRKYAASQTWGVKVNYFMGQIEKFAQNYPVDVELEEIELAALNNSLPETAGLKTILANNIHSYSLDILN